MIASPSDASDSATDLRDRFAEAVATLAAVPTPSQVDNLRASLAGLASDTRSLVRDLDAVDELDFALVDDGERTIALWSWRRGSRRALLQFAGAVRTAKEIADELAGGQKRRVVVSREGETLQVIAQRELGDWREWPRLLSANPGVAPGELASGTTLVIPEKR